MLQTKPKKNYSYNYIDKDKKNNRNKEKISFVRVIGYLLIILLIGLILVSYICQFVKIAHLGYEVNSLETKLKKIEEENNLLNYKLAKEKSLARIEKIAKNDLNMVEPDEVEILVLEDKESKEMDQLPKKDEEVLFVKIYNEFVEKMSTVKAKGLR